MMCTYMSADYKTRIQLVAKCVLSMTFSQSLKM